MESRCIRVIGQIQSEIRETRLRKTLVEAGGVVFPSPRDVDGSLEVDLATGRLIWRSLVGFHYDVETGTLQKVVEELPNLESPPSPSMLSPSRDIAYLSLHGIRVRPLARNVVHFQCRYLGKDGSDSDEEPDLVGRDDAEFLGVELGLKTSAGSEGELIAEIFVYPRN